MGFIGRIFGGAIRDGGLHGRDGLVMHLRRPVGCGVGGEVMEHQRCGVGDGEEVGGFLRMGERQLVFSSRKKGERNKDE